MPNLCRGARPSPRHELAAATPHAIVVTAPPECIYIPHQLSMYGNDVNGCCVTSEEAFAKACYAAGTNTELRPTYTSPYPNVTDLAPEIIITDAEVIAWATAGGFLNGAYLTDVLTAMQSGGFVQGGSIYTDGLRTSVDWTNAAILKNAIYNGPVKIGVAADQLQNVVTAMPTLGNGWFATGFQPDSNLDHCVSLCGYGAISWLAKQLSVDVPSGIDGVKPGYALFTWSTIGIIDVPSLLAICGEAWLRNPTTVVKVQSQPAHLDPADVIRGMI